VLSLSVLRRRSLLIADIKTIVERWRYTSKPALKPLELVLVSGGNIIKTGLIIERDLPMNARTPLFAIVLVALFVMLGVSVQAVAEHEHKAQLLDDKQAPTVIYPSSAPMGDNKQFTVTVKDDAGIQSVTLFYRKPNSSQFMTTRMKRVGESNSYITDLGKHGFDNDNDLDFNILAVDLAGNSQLIRGKSGQALASADSSH